MWKFYPINPGNETWTLYFNSTAELALNKTKESITLHAYNSHRYKTKSKNEYGSAISVLGRKHCPKTAAPNWDQF